MSRARLTALGVSGVILLALVSAPWLAHEGRLEASVIYAVFKWFCHQNAERSWHWLGQPLPVCVRCWGFYIGAFSAAVLGLRFSKRALGWALLAMLGTVAVESVGVVAVPPLPRWLTGVALGLAMAPAVASMEPTRAPRQRPQSSSRTPAKVI